MTVSMSGSGLKPIARARGVAKRTGQVLTIASMRASGFQDTRFATPDPAIFPIAAIISATVTVIPGRFTTRFQPQAGAGSSYAWMKASTTLRGESSHTPVSGGSGHSYAIPFRGSRTTALAKDEAAAFAFPGRTTMVGRRSDLPSI